MKHIDVRLRFGGSRNEFFFKKNLSCKVEREGTRGNDMIWREAREEIRKISMQNKLIDRTTNRVETEAVVKRQEEAPKGYVCNKTGHYTRNSRDRKEKKNVSVSLKENRVRS
jgi:hypothetical protein